MAKQTNKLAFTKAIINVDDMTITEFLKDEVKKYSLYDVMKEWHNIDGISVTFSKDNEIPSSDDE